MAQAVTLVSSATCKVSWTKISYDGPAGEQEFIELDVVKNDNSVQTLGDCGLGALALYDSSSCLVPYQTIPLNNIQVQGSDHIIICNGDVEGGAAGAGGGSGMQACQVQVSPADWLRNTPSELAFLGVNATTPLVWGFYELEATSCSGTACAWA